MRARGRRGAIVSIWALKYSAAWIPFRVPREMSTLRPPCSRTPFMMGMRARGTKFTCGVPAFRALTDLESCFCKVGDTCLAAQRAGGWSADRRAADTIGTTMVVYRVHV